MKIYVIYTYEMDPENNNWPVFHSAYSTPELANAASEKIKKGYESGVNNCVTYEPEDCDIEEYTLDLDLNDRRL